MYPVPVVYMARNVMILMRTNPLQGPATSNGPCNGFAPIKGGSGSKNYFVPSTGDIYFIVAYFNRLQSQAEEDERKVSNKLTNYLREFMNQLTVTINVVFTGV